MNTPAENAINLHHTHSKQEKCPRCRGKFLFNFDTGEVKEARCKAYICSVCGDWKKYELKKAIEKFIESWDRVRLWTFTFSSHVFYKMNVQERMKLASKVWKTFRDLCRSSGILQNTEKNFQYVKFVELQENGSPHFHALVDRFVFQPKLNRIWQRAIQVHTNYTGTPGNANVSKNDNTISKKTAAKYVIKYITKQIENSDLNFLFRRWSKSGKGTMFAKREKSGDWLFIHLNSDRYSVTSIIEFAIFQREKEKKPPNELFSVPTTIIPENSENFEYGND